jgi:hypothetical protein
MRRKSTKYHFSISDKIYLFDFDECKPISSLITINTDILQNLDKDIKDIFDNALHSAYNFISEAELHKIISKQLIEKDMIF